MFLQLLKEETLPRLWDSMDQVPEPIVVIPGLNRRRTKPGADLARFSLTTPTSDRWFKCNQSRVLVQVNQSEVLVFVKSVLSFWFMCNQFKVFGSSVANLRF